METKITEKQSVLALLGTRYNMEEKEFLDTIKKTVIPTDKAVSDAQLLAFLAVAHEYNLNPLTKEIYAYPAKGGGITPVVSVDGWMSLANRHTQFDGMDFEDTLEDSGKMISVTCIIYRKDRSRPIRVSEYMAECVRQTEPWRQMPRRMLRHKSLIQCVRYAFGYSGIYDQDEAERINEMKDITPPLSDTRLSLDKIIFEEKKREAEIIAADVSAQRVAGEETLTPWERAMDVFSDVPTEVVSLSKDFIVWEGKEYDYPSPIMTPKILIDFLKISPQKKKEQFVVENESHLHIIRASFVDAGVPAAAARLDEIYQAMMREGASA